MKKARFIRFGGTALTLGFLLKRCQTSRCGGCPIARFAKFKKFSTFTLTISLDLVPCFALVQSTSEHCKAMNIFY
ncbi:hypothetical protein F5890DRAFT_649892 [Lentinula detonsa]|uniref:Secreted protein n=1 Tax=Lentinula detonsa TaxID=2804962 RepID=A0AA38PT30_9AGAR|nr:hypothetical protein F5890DRAFT_649892 [Lentinula detonsa]